MEQKPSLETTITSAVEAQSQVSNILFMLKNELVTLSQLLTQKDEEIKELKQQISNNNA